MKTRTEFEHVKEMPPLSIILYRGMVNLQDLLLVLGLIFTIYSRNSILDFWCISWLRHSILPEVDLWIALLSVHPLFAWVVQCADGALPSDLSHRIIFLFSMLNITVWFDLTSVSSILRSYGNHMELWQAVALEVWWCSFWILFGLSQWVLLPKYSCNQRACCSPYCKSPPSSTELNCYLIDCFAH
jgi:hypothetical protein